MEPALTRTDTDDQLIELWLHGRPDSTMNEYRRDVQYFRQFQDLRPLQSLTLEDLQRFATSLEQRGLAAATKKRKLNTIKSLFSFAAKLRYVPFNVAAALRLPAAPRTLAGRILKQSEVFRIQAGAITPRNRAFLELLYATGARVSEICRLRWQDFEEREGSPTKNAQVTLLGKGEEYRTVIIPESVWSEVKRLQGSALVDSPVFCARQNLPISRATGHNIIKKAIAKIGGNEKVSCHWFRHAHAQEALRRGAPLHLVRDTLGHSSIAVTNIYLESNPEDSSSRYLGL